jgi:hypothetical protein
MRLPAHIEGLASLLASDSEQVAPSASSPSSAEIYTVYCPWKNCGQPVSATRAGMEKAARAHLKQYHAGDDDLKRVEGLAKSCRCSGCQIETMTVRTHVARTHFAAVCKPRRSGQM